MSFYNLSSMTSPKICETVFHKVAS